MKRISILMCVAALLFCEAAMAQYAGEAKPTRKERFDRGLAFDTKTPSMPKGMWVAGINASFSKSNNDNYNIFIVNDLAGKGNNLSISPMVHYVFANNQSIGVKFQYRNQLIDLEDVLFHLTPELNTMLFGEDGNQYKYTSDSYMGFVSYRYYIGIGSTKRLLLFNEVQAGYGGGTQREDSGRTDAGTFKRSTWQKSESFRIGFAPGATMFLTNSLAAEVQIGLLGYEYKKFTQETTEAVTSPGEVFTPQKGSRSTHNISAKFDFFSIEFGIKLYL